MASAGKGVGGRLCSLPVPFNFRVDEIHRLLRLGSSLEDQAFVGFQRLQPSFNVRSTLIKGRRDPQLNTQKTRADLCNQFLERVSGTVLKTLDPVEPCRAPGPVSVMPMSA